MQIEIFEKAGEYTLDQPAFACAYPAEISPLSRRNDADYIQSLEYGLPPTAGLDVNINRMVMFFTDCASIRDMAHYPHLRPAG